MRRHMRPADLPAKESAVFGSRLLPAPHAVNDRGPADSGFCHEQARDAAMYTSTAPKHLSVERR
jgi:hypothetical protein